MTYPPPPSTTIKIPMRKSVLIAVIVIVIVALAVVVFVLLPILNSPNPEIISFNGHQDSYTYYVDVNVKNNGASGWVTIYAEIDTADQYQKQEAKLYLGNGEIQSKTFSFTLQFDAGQVGKQIHYEAWAVTS